MAGREESTWEGDSVFGVFRMKWTTRSGEVMNISDMETSHLKNAIDMLRRNGFIGNNDALSCLGAAFSLSGEMAQYYAEQSCYDMKVSPVLNEMEAEYERRLT